MRKEISRRQCLILGLPALVGLFGCQARPEVDKVASQPTMRTPDFRESSVTPFGKLISPDSAFLTTGDLSQKRDLVELGSLLVRTVSWEGLLVKVKNNDKTSEQEMATYDDWWRTSLFQQVRDPLDCNRRGYCWGMGLRTLESERKGLVSALYVTDDIRQGRGGPKIQTWVSIDGINWRDLGKNSDFDISGYGGWTMAAKKEFFSRDIRANFNKVN